MIDATDKRLTSAIRALLSVFVLCTVMGPGCDSDEIFLEENRESFKLHGINFSPYLRGQDPEQGTTITEEQLTERMRIVEPHTEWIRTFGCVNGLENAGRIAHEMGLKSAIGAWLDKDLATNEAEIANLISVANQGEVDMAIVGSETLIRSDLTEEQLIGYILQVRDAVPDTVLVTTADVCAVVLNHPDVIEAVDVVMVNHYPYWGGIKLDCAVSAVHACHRRLEEASNDKKVIVSETGWPSCGNVIGDARPSPENAGQYFLNFISWARSNGIETFYFEAFDERWKTKHEGPQGACWGIWDEDGNLKDGMNRVFEGKRLADNWSDTVLPGGPGRPAIVFTDVPRYGTSSNLTGEVWHARSTDYQVVVYILVSGKWWIKPYFNRPLTRINCEGAWTCDVTTGGIDEQATRFIAFLVPNGYNPPLAGGWSSLPQGLYDTAIAITEIKRLR